MSPEKMIDLLRKAANNKMSKTPQATRMLLQEASDEFEARVVADREALDRLNEKMAEECRNLRAAKADAAAWKSLARVHELQAARNAEEVARINIVTWKLRYEAAQSKTMLLKTANHAANYGMSDKQFFKLGGEHITGNVRTSAYLVDGAGEIVYREIDKDEI